MSYQGDHSEYRAMLGRMLRAYTRRVADQGSVEDLAEMVTLRAALDDAIVRAAADLHDQGVSWTEISRPLGITRQAARQRFARRAAADRLVEMAEGSRAHAAWLQQNGPRRV